MDDMLEQLKRLLDDPSMPVDAAWVDEMSEKYPYFTLPAVMELERNGSSIDAGRRKKITQRVALNSGCPDALYRLMEPMGASLDGFYPPADNTSTPTTEEAISTFIGTYGGTDGKEEEILERLIFNPTPDYAQILADEEERSLPDGKVADDGSQDSLINAFILKSRGNHGHFPPVEEPKEEPQEAPAETHEAIQPPVHQDEGLLSESLAKIYIKQRRYSKAYEIISNLSLKYPEKSIYFADQLRFLQKLIINQQYLKQK